MNSIWENNATMPTFPKLKQDDIRSDDKIIGISIFIFFNVKPPLFSITVLILKIYLTALRV